jgi:hypothetical protein
MPENTLTCGYWPVDARERRRRGWKEGSKEEG